MLLQLGEEALDRRCLRVRLTVTARQFILLGEPEEERLEMSTAMTIPNRDHHREFDSTICVHAHESRKKSGKSVSRVVETNLKDLG